MARKVRRNETKTTLLPGQEIEIVLSDGTTLFANKGEFCLHNFLDNPTNEDGLRQWLDRAVEYLDDRLSRARAVERLRAGRLRLLAEVGKVWQESFDGN